MFPRGPIIFTCYSMTHIWEETEDRILLTQIKKHPLAIVYLWKEYSQMYVKQQRKHILVFDQWGNQIKFILSTLFDFSKCNEFNCTTFIYPQWGVYEGYDSDMNAHKYLGETPRRLAISNQGKMTNSVSPFKLPTYLLNYLIVRHLPIRLSAHLSALTCWEICDRRAKAWHVHVFNWWPVGRIRTVEERCHIHDKTMCSKNKGNTFFLEKAFRRLTNPMLWNINIREINIHRYLKRVYL